MGGEGAGSRATITVYPSEIHEFVYCPRLYFFELYMGRKRGIHERIRLLLGSLFHVFKSIPDRARGRRVEERIEVHVGGGIRLRGRPDAYHVDKDTITVIERKSSRPPRKGVWLNDSAQAATYGFMLTRRESRSNVRIRIEYPTVSRESVLDSEKISFILKIIDDIVLVKRDGILPAPRPTPKKCAKCPFQPQCKLLEEDKPEELYEPGAWLEGFIDESYE